MPCILLGIMELDEIMLRLRNAMGTARGQLDRVRQTTTMRSKM